MNKLQKFAALKAMGLTKEEAEEYFACQIGEDTVPKRVVPLEEKDSDRIKTSLMLAYVNEDGVELLPYLDMNKASSLWGIRVGDFVYNKDVTTLPFASWYDLMDSLGKEKVANLPIVLPSADDFIDVYTCKDRFHKIVELLRLKGISADYWEDGWYSSRDGYCDLDDDSYEDEYFSFGMHNGECEILSKENIPNLVRVGFVIEA